MKPKTTWTTKEKCAESRQWYLVDVKDQVLGRAATRIAELLIGKHKANRVPNMDCGDYVVVINAQRIRLTRNKANSKEYFRHSGFPGGAKFVKFKDMLEKNPDFVIRHAVKNMLPNNKLRASMLKRLFVYADDSYEQKAQKPEEFKL